MSLFTASLEYAKKTAYAACESADQYMLRSRCGRRAYGVARSIILSLADSIKEIRKGEVADSFEGGAILERVKRGSYRGGIAGVILSTTSYGYAKGFFAAMGTTVIAALVRPEAEVGAYRSLLKHKRLEACNEGHLSAVEGAMFTPYGASAAGLGFLVLAKKLGIKDRDWKPKRAYVTIICNGTFILGGPVTTVVVNVAAEVLSPLYFLFRSKFEDNQEKLDVLLCRIAVQTGDSSIVRSEYVQFVECQRALLNALRSKDMITIVHSYAPKTIAFFPRFFGNQPSNH